MQTLDVFLSRVKFVLRDAPGLGIEWDWGAIGRLKLCELAVN